MNQVLAFLFSVILISSAFAKTEVQLQTSVEVGSSLGLQLEDLVLFNDYSANTMRSLIDLDVPFKAGQVSQADVLDWLKSATQTRPDLRDIVFKIPQQIEIKVLTGLVKSQIRQRIQSRLEVKCADCLFQIQISNVPETKLARVILDWKEIPMSGAFMLPVTSVEGQNLSWISGQIKSQRQIVKAARVLRAGDTVQDADLMTDWSDVTFVKDYYLKTSELVGKKASRYITRGNHFTSQDILRDYDVRQGQVVKTITGSENFEITLQTVAQESGVAGDTIRVRNSANQKMLSARITEKGTVRIE